MIFAGLCHLPGYLCLQWYWDASLPAPLSAKGSWQSLCNKASLTGIVSQYGINIWHATRSCKEPIASPNKDDNNLTQIFSDVGKPSSWVLVGTKILESRNKTLFFFLFTFSVNLYKSKTCETFLFFCFQRLEFWKGIITQHTQLPVARSVSAVNWRPGSVEIINH